ncbi:MAG: beta-ketoacyl synthase N-terminal-like domain-containing protein, partial [Ignavibacteria bacterium]|nr:beta-ketoacyl synthase N-terminal-like domain-containing protein [Ignavibacteria bacterium]
MNKRVVITGLGVAAPNGTGILSFTEAIKNGKSGIKFLEELKNLNFSCCIGGIPEVHHELKQKYFTPLQLRNFNSSGIIYGCIAGIDAWKDAGLKIAKDNEPDWESGLIFGAGTSG